MKRKLILALGGVCLAAAVGCGGDDGPCDPAANSGCDDGLVCEEVEGGDPACFAPVLVRGDVIDLGDQSAIGGANVVAVDVDRAAVSNVGTSNDEGRYEIRIPSTRNADGAPAAIELTLRADATGYESFPGGLRQPLPIDTATAVEGDNDGWVLDTAQSDIGLFALADTTNNAKITGHVELPAGAGAIVVAENSSGTGITGYDAVVGRDGNFAILNLPAGDFTVRAYSVGLVHESVDVTLAASGTQDVDLGLTDAAAQPITGTLQFVNAGTQVTSVVLFVESTFDANLSRGAAPPLLRADNVTGSFTIEGVPPGRYVVLAAFDNDELVRDPDTCIAGTSIVSVEVADQPVAIADSFKVTAALAMLQPTADAVYQGGLPTFSWVDDSSEDMYRVTVYDSFGQVAWTQDIAGSSGTNPVVTYDGTALPTGYYQVRVTSLRTTGGTGGSVCEISTSEDLAGVFFVP